MEFCDDYEHENQQLTYILESIKTQEVEILSTNGFIGCECDKDCTLNCCPCIQRSGAQYSFFDKQDISSYSLESAYKDKPVYECNDNCKCNSKCGNRLVQFGPIKSLQIINTKKGLGLTTNNVINKGSFICEYAGEIITHSETLKRYKMYAEMKLDHNYIFCINEHFGDRNEKTFIDPTFYGNVGRYINHSCQPNSILVPIRVNDDIPKLCIFAKEIISKNQEVTFDYGETDNSNSNSNKKLCLCGAENCRGYLPFDPTL